MQKYGIAVDQLGAHGQAAAQAAERHGARTVIYRDKVAVAALVPMSDMERVDPVQLGDSAADPLLALCGTCSNDMFVDSMSELSSTVLFKRTLVPPAVTPGHTQQIPVPQAPPKSATPPQAAPKAAPAQTSPHTQPLPRIPGRKRPLPPPRRK